MRMKKKITLAAALLVTTFLVATVYASSVITMKCTVQGADGMNITLDCGKKGKEILADKPAKLEKACTVKEVKGNIVTLDCSNLIKVAHQIKLKAKSRKEPEGC